MATEYGLCYYLSPKADVFSFGIVTLEIVSEKSNNKPIPREEFFYLPDWAYRLNQEGKILQLVDPYLGSEYSKEEALHVINVALLCVHSSREFRATMSQTIDMLEGRRDIKRFYIGVAVFQY
ncbi:hypothetical protein L1987_71493 [Smallanthus sonchifolius]|uniref:Uncharacterized protein n=1 Tax=Smallanthus sonchifolius TaxID=185202 RepID=A0ACB9AU69_9ASTR|nr:hypothetical protein L1987_71493 [Smallanthus sonchifolius]